MMQGRAQADLHMGRAGVARLAKVAAADLISRSRDTNPARSLEKPDEVAAREI